MDQTRSLLIIASVSPNAGASSEGLTVLCVLLRLGPF